ncbi:MAG: N-formylglutamate amidohydrolase [Planctomycetaceae bacterium]
MTADSNGAFVAIDFGDAPIVATAIHDGHAVRDEVRPLLALTDAERLREEDPFTGRWTSIAVTRLVARRSRFEVDLNRPREQAVYLRPEDAWGLNVWKATPSAAIVARSLSDYDSFYALLHTVLSRLVERHGRVVVLDLHTYNHRRDGADGRLANPQDFPDVNIGTGSMSRNRWASLVDRFIADLGGQDDLGRRLDVRENVCFQGGNMSRWIHAAFPTTVCSLAIEFKKFFMDEWTGVADERQVAAIGDTLASTVPGLLAELREIEA